MLEFAPVLLTIACCALGAWVLSGAWRTRPVLSIPLNQPHMRVPMHLIGGLALLGGPVLIWHQRLPLPAVILWIILNVAAIFYVCIADYRHRRT